MNLSLLLDLAASAAGERVGVVGDDGRAFTYDELAARTWAGAEQLHQRGATALVHIGTNHPSFPVAVFAAAAAGLPFVPLNYRLAPDQLADLAALHPGALVVHDPSVTPPAGSVAVTGEDFLAACDTDEKVPEPRFVDPDAVAVVIYTSGTTAAPKGVLLRHRHLMAYVLGTVELASADPGDAALVAVPPYHVAGLANLLTNVYAARRIVYLARFEPGAWLDAVRRHGVTHAMVVPTMLARLVGHLDDAVGGAGEAVAGPVEADVPTLRTLSYGGARTPAPVLERALRLFPHVGFVHAYGLTETSSTIALLGPEDHRAAVASADPAVQARLGSCGRLLPGIEIEIRHPDGPPVAPGETGLVFLRGEQVSGEYSGGGGADAEGWFATRDQGRLDAEGYLFIEGRADDTIIRGGENVAPAEVEDVLLDHPGVLDVAVVGPPDDEWGQRIVAVVVAAPGSSVDEEELRAWARARLRSSKTPDRILFRSDLPRTDTGKLLRRAVLADVTAPSADGPPAEEEGPCPTP